MECFINHYREKTWQEKLREAGALEKIMRPQTKVREKAELLET
jgi:hypothetical protein